ncbi:MAG: TonB-dependent receptor [Bacteroides sp.]|nr:TonB-dependent receptor [Bacteroides sp.]
MSNQSKMIGVLLFSFILSGGVINASSNGDAVGAGIVQQTGTCTGIVKDARGEPVIGANVVVSGTTNGVITGIDGDFQLSNVKKGDVIQIPFLGYITQSVTYSGKPLNIVLQEDSQTLDEVVVVGFGTQKKASVVGAVQSMKSSELRVPSSSLSNAFAGRIAGVISMQRNAEPGADGANFWIRGAATFSGATNPLIFIDGVEASGGDMNAIPPEAIENFSVLKDASATALYGARGANGVILITTRSGTVSEKARINIRIDNTFSGSTRMLKMADAPTVMQMRNNSILTRNPNGTPFYSEEKISNTIAGTNPYLYPNVDWLDYMFKDMTTNQSANINVAGGTNKVDYFLSASLNNDNGLLRSDPNNKFDNNIQNLRYSIQSNVGAWLTKTTKINVRINSQIINYSGPSISVSNLYQYALEAPNMYFQPYYPNTENLDHVLFGNQAGGPIGAGTTSIYRNPYALMAQGLAKNSESAINVALDLDQKLDFITKGLSFKALVSYKNWSKTKVTRSFVPYYYQLESADPIEGGGYDFKYNSLNQGSTALSTSTGTEGDRWFNLQASLNYQRTFGEKHDVGAMLVYLQREYNINNPGDYYATLPERNQGLAGRATYAYDGKYLAEVNFGYNGSETFKKGNRFGFFPSFALGYLISNEDFFKPLTKVFTSLKIRGSYGLVGNSNIYDSAGNKYRFPYLTKVNLGGAGYIFGNNWQTSGNGAIITTYGAANVTWEVGAKYNIGVDMLLFNKLNISADYFRENRKDIFLQRQTIGAETGITGNLRPYANLGKVRNEGFDMSAVYSHQVNKDLMITARGTFTYAKNQYVEIDEPDFPFDYMSQVGRPLNAYKGLIAEGLFTSEEEIKNHPEQVLSSTAVKVGDIKYKDLNGDNKIDENDMTYIGQPEIPQISYGFGASVNYKGWDASFFFQGVAKRSIMLNGIAPFAGDSQGVLQWVADNYWNEDNPNPNAEYPRLTNGINQNSTVASTYWLRDGSYIRLKSVELGYTYKFARVYLSGQNLLTFSKFKIWDPELYTSNGLKYPTQKTVTVGVQFTF